MRFIRLLLARFTLLGLKSRKPSLRCKALFDIDRIKYHPRIVDLLLEAMNDEDKDVRRMAMLRLSDIHDPRAILPTIDFLKTEVGETEITAAKLVLAEFGLHAIPHLTQMLCEFDQIRVLDAASEILIDIGEDSIKPVINMACESTDSYVISISAHILGKIGIRAIETLGNSGKTATPLLIAILKANDIDFYGEEAANSDMSNAFAQAFRNIGNSAIVALLSLARDSLPRIRKRALHVLSNMKPPHPDLRDILLSCLKDEDELMRCTAASELIQFTGDPDIFRPLCQALMDHNEAVRAWAATTLGSTHKERGVKSLIALLKREKNKDIQKFHIEESLVSIGEPAIKPLIDVLADSRVHAPGRITAVWALRQLHAKKAMDVLIMALEDRNPQVRHGAIIAIGELGEAQVGRHLVPLLWHNFWNTREFAAEALGKVGYSAATNALIWTLVDDNERVRATAAKALCTLTGCDFGYDPRKWQTGLPKEVLACGESDIDDGTFYTFLDKTNRFSFQYPTGWFRRTNNQGQLIVFPTTARVIRGGSNCPFLCSVGVDVTAGVADHIVGQPVKTVYSELLKLEPDSFEDHKLRWSEETTTKSGEEALLHSFDFTSSGGDPFRAIVLSVASGQRLIQVSASSIVDEFNQNEDIFRVILASLVLL